MLALSALHPVAIPTEVAAGFLSLSSVHRDGWGHAGADALATGLTDAESTLRPLLATPTTTSLTYLRFASGGSAVTPENLQPFVRNDLAFMHNGALVPRARGLAVLTDTERDELRGTTDSEIYFALVTRAIETGRGSLADRVQAGVDATRALYPDACLNAMLLVQGRLVVIAARGTVAPPFAAFAARDADPPGDDYNTLLRMDLAPGVTIVATSGVPDGPAAWSPIPDETVLVFP